MKLPPAPADAVGPDGLPRFSRYRGHGGGRRHGGRGRPFYGTGPAGRDRRGGRARPPAAPARRACSHRRRLRGGRAAPARDRPQLRRRRRAHGNGVGFNLQAGYFGDAENALWLEGKLIALGSVAVVEAPDGCWTLRTADGLLDLRVTPEGTRRDDKQLLIASSRMRQHVGRFDGWVKAAPDAPRVAVTGLAGLAEDYTARW